MTTRAKALMVAALAALLAGFLYLQVLTRRVRSERGERGEEAARAKLNEAALQSQQGPTQSAILYFPSQDEGVLIAESRPMAWAQTDTDRIRQVLLALIEGSHQGQSRPLPPSTDIRAVFLTSDGTSYLDFSSQALALFPSGIESETLALYSIVDSLAANVPSVKRVRILVQGQEVDSLNGHADVSGPIAPDPARIKPAS